MGEVLGPLVPVAGIAMIIFVLWFNSREKRAKIQARAELNKQLLEKFASAQELTEFLERESGQRFLDGMGPGKQETPKEKILGIIVPGCILTAIGSGFFWLGTDRSGLLIPGAVISATGVGLLIAAAVTYVFSKRWGLMNGKKSSGGRYE